MKKGLLTFLGGMLFCSFLLVSFHAFASVIGDSAQEGKADSLQHKKIATGTWLNLSAKALDENGEEIPLFDVELLPKFPGGYDSLANFVGDALEYPQTAIDDNIQGQVVTSFVVDWNGKVKNIEIRKGVRHDLDSVCINSISILPDWIPAQSSKEKKINVQFILPIKFKLTD